MHQTCYQQLIVEHYFTDSVIINVLCQYASCPPGWISLATRLGCILFHTEACGGTSGPGCSWLAVGSWAVSSSTRRPVAGPRDQAAAGLRYVAVQVLQLASGSISAEQQASDRYFSWPASQQQVLQLASKLALDPSAVNVGVEVKRRSLNISNGNIVNCTNYTHNYDA